MRTALKWAGALIGTALILSAALILQSWYFRPLRIGIFFERVLIQFLLEDPEAASSLGIFERLGYKGFDGSLTDVSPAHEEKLARMVREDLATLHRYDRSSLAPSEQLSYDVLDWFLQDQVNGQRWLYYDYPVNQLFGVQSATPDFMVQIHPIGDGRDARNYISRLTDFRRQFDGLLEGLRLREAKGIVPPGFVIARVLAEMRAFIAVPPTGNVLYINLREKLGKLPGIPPSERSRLLGQARQAIEQAVYPAYRTLITYFEQLAPRVALDYGVWRLPDGDAYYDYLIRSHTTTSLDAAAVHQIGLEEVARIEKELDAILRSQGLDHGTVGARIALLNADPRFQYPNDESGRAQCLADYQRYINEIIRDLPRDFAAPPALDVRVERVPAFKEKTAPGAYADTGSLDGSRVGVFYVNLRDMREIWKYQMRTLAYHEAVPGHQLQAAIAQRLPDVPIFRKVLPFTAYDEGWALYAEQLAWEMGFERAPLDNLGRLQAEMFRAVRLVVDTGIHHLRWTREQAIAYMMEKTGMAEGEVVSEVERYYVVPAQALAYKIGMLKILQLRSRAQEQLGARFDIRQFHAVVLGNGALPLGILEKQVDAWLARAGNAPAAGETQTR
ncbi:MAG TPA: DUF885 domain-containing protein [Steroidobacteraceae bacterium]|jgi:uncharacterized protein (DUF885 family)